MKKLFLSIISLVLCVCVLFAVSIATTGAVTLYTDGIYTYADIDEDYVALYSYDESTPTLVVPDMYRTRYVSSIYEYAFEDNETITAIDFSQCRKLDTIGLKSFTYCTNLSGTLTLPSSVRTIGLGAFEGCSSLTTAVINSSVKSIPQQCFNRCSLLSEVYMSPSVERIESLAFANCYCLRDVYLTTSVNYISRSAFLNSNLIRFNVYKDSYAHQYAIDNNIPYILLDGPKLGDVNGDGNVDILDSTEIQKFAAEMIELTDEQFELADINNDGFVDVIDALLVQKCVVGKYDIPPIIYNS